MDNTSHCSSSADWDLKCSRDSLARSDDVVAAAGSGWNDSGMAIGCSRGAYMDSVPRKIAGSKEDCSGWVTAELDVPEPVLGTADLDAAAWRTDVSCWTPVNNANSFEARLPFGE